MLHKRAMVAIPILLILAFILRIDMQYKVIWGLASVTGLLAFLGVREFWQLSSSSAIKVFKNTGTVLIITIIVIMALWANSQLANSGIESRVASVLLPGSDCLYNGLALLFALFCAASIVVFFVQGWQTDLKNALHNIAATMLGVFYLGCLPTLLFILRCVTVHTQLNGIDWILTGILVAKFADIGGYLFGSCWGKHKLIPHISPGKSWEGLVGSIVLATVVMLILGQLIPQSDNIIQLQFKAVSDLPILMQILLAVILTLVGLFGDLAESILKRGSALKDAGAIIPGFGGVLDLIDSILFVTPVLLLFLWLYY